MHLSHQLALSGAVCGEVFVLELQLTHALAALLQLRLQSRCGTLWRASNDDVVTLFGQCDFQVLHEMETMGNCVMEDIDKTELKEFYLQLLFSSPLCHF